MHTRCWIACICVSKSKCERASVHAGWFHIRWFTLGPPWLEKTGPLRHQQHSWYWFYSSLIAAPLKLVHLQPGSARCQWTLVWKSSASLQNDWFDLWQTEGLGGTTATVVRYCGEKSKLQRKCKQKFDTAIHIWNTGVEPVITTKTLTCRWQSTTKCSDTAGLH